MQIEVLFIVSLHHISQRLQEVLKAVDFIHRIVPARLIS